MIQASEPVALALALTLLGACQTLVGYSSPPRTDTPSSDRRQAQDLRPGEQELRPRAEDLGPGAEDLSLGTKDLPLVAKDLPLPPKDVPVASKDLPLVAKDLPHAAELPRDGRAVDRTGAGSDSPPPCATNWWTKTWTRRLKISIDASAVTASLSSFPLLVRLDLSAYDAADFLPGGTDVRFVSSTGATLPHEIELWDATQKIAWLWVAVPSITSGASGQYFWIYFRNPSPGSQVPGTVWDASFVGVWHLQKDPTAGKGAVTDSSPAQSHGTASGMSAASRAAAQIGAGYAFDGQAYVRVPSTATGPLAVTQLTLEAWVRLDATGTSNQLYTVVGRQFANAWEDTYTLLVEDNPLNVRFQTYSPSTPDILSSTQVTKNAWRHLAGVRDATELRLYIDGVQVAKLAATGSVKNDLNDVTIGCEENDATTTPTECWRGMLDEVRVSKVARSASWIAASYRSGAGTLVSLGPVERCGN